MTETGSWLRPLAMLRFVGEDINAQSEAALNGHKHALGRHVRDKVLVLLGMPAVGVDQNGDI